MIKIIQGDITTLAEGELFAQGESNVNYSIR